MTFGNSEWLSTLQGVRQNRTIARILCCGEQHASLRRIGRPAPVEGFRELAVRNVPYVVVYQVDATAIEVVAVYHMAQDR